TSDRDYSTLLYTHHFNGAGPTLLVELSRPFGDLGINVYGNVRIAGLIGREAQAALLASNTGGNGPVFSNLAFGHSVVIPNLEYEAGLIWQVNYLDVTPFVQGGFFGSSWFGAGTASSWDHGFSLLGAKIAIGLRF